MQLKKSLLFNIIENTHHPNRYSRAFSSLKNVFEIEENENEQTLPQDVKDKFLDIEKKYNKFLSNIPLVVIERYYFEHRGNMNKYVYLNYNEKELSDLKVSELLVRLEMFYDEMLNLACYIANFYNLEIKLNSPRDNVNDFL